MLSALIVVIESGRRTSARFVLEGDIKARFERLSHEWLLRNVLMDKSMLRKWLGAGFIERHALFATRSGTPQGGIISPCLAVATMSSLEKAVKQVVDMSDRVHVVAYADDFVITGASKEVLENKVMPALKAFLDDRGLSLSEKKTKITSITKGFDFLGCNVRKYQDKLIIKPSRQNIKVFLSIFGEPFTTIKVQKLST